MGESVQDKAREAEFFSAHARTGEYDVFDPASSAGLLDRCVELAGLVPPARVADLGCASGVFTGLLAKRGFDAVGIDISEEMISLASRLNPGLEFRAGDVENLPLPDSSLDGVLLSGVLHHLPDPGRCAREVWRVLKPGGRFAAFDPNRLNPFMYFYRDRTSPFYSSKGVTVNERPVLARALAGTLEKAGFDVRVDYLGGLRYRYVASPLLKRLLWAYNAVDMHIVNRVLPRRMLPFVITAGVKRERPSGGGQEGRCRRRSW